MDLVSEYDIIVSKRIKRQIDNRRTWRKIFNLTCEPVWFTYIIISNYLTVIIIGNLSVNGKCMEVLNSYNATGNIKKLIIRNIN